MMLYMLDTNACIGIINNKPTALRQKLFQVAVEQVAISQIVLYELEYGICRSQHQQRNRDNLINFLGQVEFERGWGRGDGFGFWDGVGFGRKTG